MYDPLSFYWEIAHLVDENVYFTHWSTARTQISPIPDATLVTETVDVTEAGIMCAFGESVASLLGPTPSIRFALPVGMKIVLPIFSAVGPEAPVASPRGLVVLVVARDRMSLAV